MNFEGQQDLAHIHNANRIEDSNITLFRSIIMFCGTDNILQNIPQKFKTIFKNDYN